MKKNSSLTGFLWLIGIIAVFVLGGRIGNTLLIYDDANLVVKSEFCAQLVGQVNDNVCLVEADLSHTFWDRNPVLRLKDGRIIELNKAAIKAYSFSESRYSLAW